MDLEIQKLIELVANLVNDKVFSARRDTMKLALNIQEAADALSVSRTFMYELIDSGRIRTVNLNEGLTDQGGLKKNRYRRIAVSEIQRYLDDNAKGPKN